MLCFSVQDNWKLIPNKFNISTLKPFDKVLVRLTKDGVWNATFFSHYDKEVKWGCYHFVTTSSKSYSQCIPLYGNIEKEGWSMTNKVIRHNIETYFNHLNKDYLSNISNEIDKNLYNVLYNDIIENLDMLIENMEQTYKLINHNKQYNIKEVEELIISMKQSSYLRYEMVWSSIKKCYKKYEFIKNF